MIASNLDGLVGSAEDSAGGGTTLSGLHSIQYYDNTKRKLEKQQLLIVTFSAT